MIENRKDPAIAEKLRAEAEANPVAAAVVAAAEASADPFEAGAEGTGLEVLARTELPGGIPNRARLKVFSPRAGHTLIFFYKRSLVPFSRDRYSYGGVDLRAPQAGEQEVGEWLAFLTSGFHPDKRPTNLRRAFPYEIPE